MDNELAGFLRSCRLELRRADLTCKAYERDVRAGLTFLRERGIEKLTAVRAPQLREFLAKEAETRPAVGSRTRTVPALKVFFRFCVENEYLDGNSALVLRTPKKREALPDVLDLVGAAPALSAVGADGSREDVLGDVADVSEHIVSDVRRPSRRPCYPLKALLRAQPLADRCS